MKQLRQLLLLQRVQSLSTRKVTLGLILLTTLSTHIWLAQYFSSEASYFYSKAEDLKSKILTDAGATYSSPEADSIIAKSSRNRELELLQKSTETYRTTGGIAALALTFWPIGFLVAGTLLGIKFWRAENLPPPTQEVRRERMLLVGLVATALSLAALIVAWRYFSTAENLAAPYESLFSSGGIIDNLYRSLGFAFVVLLSGFLLVELLWKLLSFGRFHNFLYSFPISSKRIPQALVLATVARVVLADIRNIKYILAIGHDSPLYSAIFIFGGAELARLTDSIALGAQAAFWFAIVFALGAAAMDYLRLPVGGGTPVSARISPSVATAASATNSNPSAASIIPSEPDLLAAGALCNEVAKLEARLATITGKFNGKLARVNGRPKQVQEAVHNRSLEIRERLLTEVHSLSKRGNLNLIIGSFTSLIAGGILWMLVADAPDVATTPQFLGYYVPRLSVAIFIEAFSFFFLKLYKSGLGDIKYYQNELTNLEARFLALELASLSSQPGDMPSLLQGLSSIDRNVVLKAGDSTVEIEKMKLEQQNLRSLVESVLKIVPDLSPKAKPSPPS